MDAGLDCDLTPHTPPTTEQERLDWLRLIRSRRVGPATFRRLMAEHGSARAALAALPDIARASGVQDYEACPAEVALAEMRAARRFGARMICMGDPAYPALLATISDAPPVLWMRGQAHWLTRPMIALVGARNASSLGLRMARRLSESLAEAGFVVVSGLARGIDAEAHAAALAHGTVAVMAGGADVIYPSENAGLADRILAEGALVTEQPFGLEPQVRHFPLRNRIISGMARAVVVVEAAARSGSLITAKEAGDQGRDVLAVPGHPFDARAAGCNQLIRDGAVLVRSAADVIEALGQISPPERQAQLPLAAPPVRPAQRTQATPRRRLGDLSGLHRLILDRLSPSPIAEDQLIRDLAVPVSEIAPQILTLELEGKVIRHPGGLIALA